MPSAWHTSLHVAGVLVSWITAHFILREPTHTTSLPCAKHNPKQPGSPGVCLSSSMAELLSTPSTAKGITESSVVPFPAFCHRLSENEDVTQELDRKAGLDRTDFLWVLSPKAGLF